MLNSMCSLNPRPSPAWSIATECMVYRLEIGILGLMSEDELIVQLSRVHCMCVLIANIVTRYLSRTQSAGGRGRINDLSPENFKPSKRRMAS